MHLAFGALHAVHGKTVLQIILWREQWSLREQGRGALNHLASRLLLSWLSQVAAKGPAPGTWGLAEEGGWILACPSPSERLPPGSAELLCIANALVWKLLPSLWTGFVLIAIRQAEGDKALWLAIVQ